MGGRGTIIIDAHIHMFRPDHMPGADPDYLSKLPAYPRLLIEIIDQAGGFGEHHPDPAGYELTDPDVLAVMDLACELGVPVNLLLGK